MRKQDSSEDDGESVKLPKFLFGCNSDGTNTNSDDDGKPITLPKELFSGNSDGTKIEEESLQLFSSQEEQDRTNALHVSMSAARKLELVAEAFSMIQIDPEDLAKGYMFEIAQC